MGEYVAGYHTVVWNATDNASNNVPSGIYFYRINAGNYSKTTKLVLLK
ncbi:MAG: T9SS type A sorting domain-containing protein [Candidatus Marinimicrobia bacterium]|nr:T9SS type A sorting domain-containing protein [Candidatus Neomarinimicrobiota bacterium]